MSDLERQVTCEKTCQQGCQRLSLGRFFSQSIWHPIWLSISHPRFAFYLAFFWHCTWHPVWHRHFIYAAFFPGFYLTIFLAASQAHSRTVYLTMHLAFFQAPQPTRNVTSFLLFYLAFYAALYEELYLAFFQAFFWQPRRWLVRKLGPVNPYLQQVLPRGFLLRHTQHACCELRKWIRRKREGKGRKRCTKGSVKRAEVRKRRLAKLWRHLGFKKAPGSR